MATKVTLLKQKRAKLIADARSIVDLADTEKRSLTTEENTRYDTMFEDIGKVEKDIDLEEKLQEVERSLADNTEKRQEQDHGADGDKVETSEQILASAARSFMLTGDVETRHYEEWRALQVGNDIEGGFLVMPEQFVNQLVKFVDDALLIKGLATVIQVPNAQSLGVPTLDTDLDDAGWTTELQTGSEDTAMRFGKRKLTPHPFAKRIKVSNDLLRSGALNVEQLVLQRLAYKFALTEEKGFLTGNGDQRPLGLFTASSQGISTGRDVSTDNTTTSITFDGIKNAFYSVKTQYQGVGQWLFHRDAIKQVSKLKDGEGQYIWRNSVVEGRPDTIEGRGVISSENAPNTFTSGLYVGMFGDFSQYWIAEAMDLQINRLGELYAETNQTGFIGRQSLDGMPVLEEAFARITLA